MSYATVLAKIKAILITATGVDSDTVYDYDRHTKNWNEYISSFQDTNDKIHGYLITRIGPIEETSEASYTNKTRTQWLIRGFYGMEDNGVTEKTFQPLVDNIRDKFRANSRLDGEILTSDPIQVDRIELLMFGDVLVHYAEMRLVTEEEETWT